MSYEIHMKYIAIMVIFRYYSMHYLHYLIITSNIRIRISIYLSIYVAILLLNPH